MTKRVAPVVLMAGISVFSCIIACVANGLAAARDTIESPMQRKADDAAQAAAAFRVGEVKCLADNIYHEARGEGQRGMVAVAFVTLNRVAEKRWGKTICEVVWSHKQFSWTNDKTLWKEDDDRSFAKALEVAMDVYARRLKDPTKGADHYHATDIHPYWTDAGADKRQIGHHLFMRL